MNIVSVEFAGFLAVVYMSHWSCRSAGARKWLLTVASYVFYAVWNWRFCFLIVTVNAFAAGQMLPRTTSRRRTAVLAANIGVDLAILGFFKYYDFFLSNAAAALADLGVPVNLPVMRIILPVGIGFYTFHAISYVVDVYRGKVGPERSFLNIALYISFFPQLIAGPIVRASFIMPQILLPRQFSSAQQAIGVRILLHGFNLQSGHRRHIGAYRRPGIRKYRPVRCARFTDRDGRLLRPALFRFCRLLEHGDRHGAAIRLPLSAELQLPVPSGIGHRVLAALAHVTIILVT